MALARIGEPAVPALIETLNDRDPKVRAAAAMALARIGSQAKAAVPALIKALKDKDPDVRREAARALGQMGPAAQEAVPALLEALRDSGDDSSEPNTGSST
jgi:HEAT repeat protein